MKNSEILQVILIGSALLGGVYVAITQATGQGQDTIVHVDVKLPKLTNVALEGKSAFDNNCISCHGENGSGTLAGPPLVHDIYNPGHHGDKSFYRAVKSGVKRHHWPYGNMPPRPGLRDSEIAKIVTYVRELQEANGIFSKPHRM